MVMRGSIGRLHYLIQSVPLNFFSAALDFRGWQAYFTIKLINLMVYYRCPTA
jgi:hypothetical protein